MSSSIGTSKDKDKMANPQPRGNILLSGHQPVYLPGIILFGKIAMSDIFMFVGHCQYVKKSWHSRNRIGLSNRELWLSVPVQTAGLFNQSINDTYTANDIWKRKHLGSIRQAYCKTPFYDLYYPALESRLLSHDSNLGDLNISLIRLMLDWLRITTPILDSRDYKIEGNQTAMLVSMCQAVGATGYLSNEGSRTYVDEKQMADAGLEHYWQAFQHPIYPQSSGFIPNLSVVDLLFNVGPAARDVVLGCGKVAPGEYAFVQSA
jgi:hypothetical protein